MKSFILLFLFSLPLVAQTGWKAEGADIIWEGVFTTDKANIVSVLDKSPNLKVGSFIDNMYKGVGNEVQNTCNGGTALMKNNLKFEFIILVDPAGYVVKVRNIKIIEKYGPMQAKTIANRCEKYFMAGNKISTQPNATENMACMDRFFTGMFSVNPQPAQGTVITSN
ncbi:hypothetical protein GR160_17875 [Flavobacterium sp. Sd200]|uniref:hypothetical protein n=1 Tax=Flavobacterium sp. Sd200 TaxID=2692211 RepID=UPI00136AD157|nr:hypothetical protein [Flavobacterium sp. Sd200]MXN93099.1 hypothetical protein [Flavobacterium sp. Sd200]